MELTHLKLSGANRALITRIEKAEAANLKRVASWPAESSAAFESMPFAGGIAVFAGAHSPMTHAMGLGLEGNVSETELEAMEEWYRVRGSACVVDLCPLADPSVLTFFGNRPYRVAEFNNVLARIISPDDQYAAGEMACAVGPEQYRQWSQVVCQGFSEYVPVTDQMIDQMVSMCGASECWLAPVEQPVAGAAMGIHEDVALFYGDATLPADRRRGWQTALIAARLEVARKRGCTLAVVSVLPGSGSQRNYERAGFELVYMRVNLSRTFD